VSSVTYFRDIHQKQMIIEETLHKVYIHDTRNDMRERLSKQHAIRYGHGFLILYSIVDKSSIDQAEMEYEFILRAKDVDYFAPVIIVGAKNDLEQERTVKDEGEKLAKRLKLPHYYVSGKENINVSEVFSKMIGMIKSISVDSEMLRKLEAGTPIATPPIATSKCTLC
jgi:GTPase SAR1 family protein